jgi:hypothetical protein
MVGGVSQSVLKLQEDVTRLLEVAQLPARDIPTVDELLDQARTDANIKKTLQNTLAELEFGDVEIEYN